MRVLIAEDETLIPVAVEEMLRWITPIVAMARTTTCPVTLGATDVDADQYLGMLYAAANPLGINAIDLTFNGQGSSLLSFFGFAIASVTETVYSNAARTAVVSGASAVASRCGPAASSAATPTTR